MKIQFIKITISFIFLFLIQGCSSSITLNIYAPKNISDIRDCREYVFFNSIENVAEGVWVEIAGYNQTRSQLSQTPIELSVKFWVSTGHTVEVIDEIVSLTSEGVRVPITISDIRYHGDKNEGDDCTDCIKPFSKGFKMYGGQGLARNAFQRLTNPEYANSRAFGIDVSVPKLDSNSFTLDMSAVKVDSELTTLSAFEFNKRQVIVREHCVYGGW